MPALHWRYLLPALLLLPMPLFADTIPERWKIEAGYDFGYPVSGYVKVRELEYDGSHLSLNNDLGINYLNSLSFRIVHVFRNSSSLNACFEYFFFNGHSAPDRKVWFNATLLDGADGLSVNSTRLYRGEIYWDKPVRIFRGLTTAFDLGLIYDGLIFRISGTIDPQTSRKEPKEDFISQALPYPEAGIRLAKDVSRLSSISLEARGTYIPLFKSFFIEGGHMWLNYATLNARLSYSLRLKHFYLTPAIEYRILKTYENSNEDTNDFLIRFFGFGISAGIIF